MQGTLNRSRTYKIALIILLLAISASLLLLNGTMDDFVPRHIAVIEETIHYGKLIEDADSVVQVPEFYIMGAQISLICGLSPEQLIYYPIQLIPYVALFFAVLYKISGSPLLSSLITFIMVCYGTTGTDKIYFWPHGIGFIIFLSILLLVIRLLEESKRSRPSEFVTALVLCISLVYVSYDLTALALVLFAVVILVLAVSNTLLIRFNEANRAFVPSLGTFSNLFLVLSITVFGLSSFVYGVFIPNLEATQEVGLSSLDKFIIAYLNPGLSTSPISPIMVSFPRAISIISAIKYALLALTILIFCVIIWKAVLKEKYLDGMKIFILTVLFANFFYYIVRFLLGGDIVEALWLPGIFSVAYFFRRPKRLKRWAIVVLVFILMCTPLYYSVMDSSQNIDRDQYRFTSYKAPVLWFVEHNDGNQTMSDELTRDFFILNTFIDSVDKGNSSPNVDAITAQYRILSTEDAAILVNLSDGSLSSHYYLLNQRLNRMSLQNWIIIESWEHSRVELLDNSQVNRIYSAPVLSIYYAT